MKYVYIGLMAITLIGTVVYKIRDDAQKELISEQLQKAQIELIEKQSLMIVKDLETQVQLNAIREQKAENVKEVIKYVKSPHNNCDFDADRVRIKQSAINSTNNTAKRTDVK